MIAFLNGTLAAKNAASAYIDVAGVGYEVFMSQAALIELPPVGSDIMVHTYMQVSDSGIALYGFLSPDEEQMFRLLVGVSGIGPKIALAALSTFTTSDLISAIVSQDVSRVSHIPGVGKKSAERIILELRDKLQDVASSSDASALGQAASSNVFVAVRTALTSMGFSSEECESAFLNAPPNLSESKLLQYALKNLGSK